MDENNLNIDSPFTYQHFLEKLVYYLSLSLEEIIGLQESSGFISVVGQKIGEEMNQFYQSMLKMEKIDRDNLAKVLVDLKRRIKGNFYIKEINENRIVLGNDKCPFGDRVKGLESLCMMTSNVFGTIVSQNQGYAKVVLDETIARGNEQCTITIILRPDVECDKEGREYFEV